MIQYSPKPSKNVCIPLQDRVLVPGGALSTYTYGEVSPIFLGQDIVKSDIFGSKENLNYVHDIF